MAGDVHTFIAGIRAETDVKYQVGAGKSARWLPLHLSQSRLDSSCGLCSFLQGAMVLLRIPRSQVERLSRTSRGPLRQLWDLAEAHYFAGTACRDIEDYAAALGTLRTEVFNPISASRLGSISEAAIRDGAVPMVWIESRSFGHWATVCGTEQRDGQVTALLTLDPSSSSPWASHFNGRLELQPRRSSRAKPPYSLTYRFIDGSTWQVKPRALLVMRSGPAPP